MEFQKVYPKRDVPIEYRKSIMWQLFAKNSCDTFIWKERYPLMLDNFQQSESPYTFNVKFSKTTQNSAVSNYEGLEVPFQTLIGRWLLGINLQGIRELFPYCNVILTFYTYKSRTEPPTTIYLYDIKLIFFGCLGYSLNLLFVGLAHHCYTYNSLH